MEPSALRSTILAVCLTLGIPAAIYIALLVALAAVPSLQAHAIYLHKVTLTWFKDVDVPEQFGFAHRQATPFHIRTADGETLHAWHVLPLGAYLAHERALLAQEGGHFRESLGFRLLRDDPAARLVLCLHGTSGTLASGWRPAGYRAASAADPARTHVVAFDYRGYGRSTGRPSEDGLIADARAAVAWAVNVAGVPPGRIVVFGQSLGSAVAIALAHELANTGNITREGGGGERMHLAGLVVTAIFADLARLTATYRIGGVVPVLAPVARVPWLFRFFTRRLSSTWDSAGRLGAFVRAAERYHITLLHAEDDGDIPVEHSVRLFREAVRAAVEDGDEAAGKGSSEGQGRGEGEVSGEELDRMIEKRTETRGEGGKVTVWETKKGVISLEVLKYGVHDKIMSFPVIGRAVSRAFEAAG